MKTSKFNIDPYNALKSLLEVTSPHLGESFLKVICHELKKLFDANLVLITEAINCNPTTKVKILYATNPSLPDSFELEGTPCKLVYENKIIQIKKGVNVKFEKSKQTDFQSFYGIPLHDCTNTCIGHIAIFSTNKRSIPTHIEDIALIFARRIEVEYERNILENENKRIHKKLKKLVITDSLTTLYNRRHFNKIAKETLKKVKQGKIIATLCYIDIDNFKIINDKYGHNKGDEILIYLAQLFKQNIRQNIDFLFRVGGEEFAIISINSSIKDSYKQISRIQKQLCKDLTNELKITLSIGLEVFQKNDYSFDDVYKRADLKMYQAKKSGKNCIIK